MPNKIRLGFIGANPRSHWASQSHFPALAASSDVEMTAVCTTRPETAEEARKAFGAKLAFHDFHTLVASPEIDAVAVCVRVPSHYEPTKAAIEAGKHVYTEWPLGRTTAEAEELAALARAKGVHTVVGLQSRVSPVLLYMKELIETGYVGEVLSCHAVCMRDGPLERPSSRAWQRDASLGANTLTIANGHVIDALRFVAGDFTRVACVVTTQVRQWYETDTRQTVDVTSPDNVLVSGKLASGAVASVHVAGVPWAGIGFRMDVYGREGTLVVTGNVSSQRGEMLRLQGAQRSHELRDLTIPDRFVWVPPEFPRGDPFNVGQMYTRFAEAIRSGENRLPTFDTAVELHRFLDTIKQASDTGRTLPVT
ncbi:MAG: gfo/Idh/MocA family oxidoreductase [Betaproteobacteria bacterium]|nr:gfo/Idh/MocA family oxidoreductase [Betaproteobacteria bacterium]